MKNLVGWRGNFRVRTAALLIVPLLEFGIPAMGQFTLATNNGAITITAYTGTGTVAVIPSATNGYPVVSIGTEAFYHKTTLSAVTIPDSITNIGEDAFIYCYGLTSVTFPASITNIGLQAFYSCTDLDNVTISNGVSGIGNGAFEDTALTNVIIPGSVTSLGASAFAECHSLTNVIISNGVPSIGENAFLSCTDLANVTIPASVTNIGASAFEGCTTLTGITIPNGVTSIGATAFDEDYALKNVTIPASVTDIEDDAFYFCTNLEIAYFLGNAPPDNGTAFLNDPAVVYYLPGTTNWGTTFGSAPTLLWNPQATALTTASGQFGFNITGPTNVTILVVACTNLSNPVWIPLATNILSVSGLSSFSDPQSARYPIRFYRFSAP